MEISAPFGPPVPEVPLSRPPLIRVVAQVRFPRIVAIDVDEKPLAVFQETIRGRFPVLRAEKTAAVLIGPDGVVPSAPRRVWRFEQLPSKWSIALTSESISVSAPTHDSHQELLDIVELALSSFEQAFSPRVCERVGTRYVDRVEAPKLLKRLPTMLRPEILGSSNVSLGARGVERRHSFTDSLYSLADHAQLHARWGFLPPDATFDPSIESIGRASWVLDLDHFSESERPWNTGDLVENGALACERIYRYFRWAVGDEFLTAHGGHP